MAGTQPLVAGAGSSGQAGGAALLVSPFTVVLTRPAGQSAALAGRLAQTGIATFEFPLIEIAPVEDDAPLTAAFAELERYALVVFVSPNAIERALDRLPRPWPASVPVGAIGPGSVAALAQHAISAPNGCEVISPAGANGGADDVVDSAPVGEERFPDTPQAADASGTDYPAAAVGAAGLARSTSTSASACAAASDAAAARFDSESLWQALEARFGAHGLAGRRVLIVRGDGGREWLAGRLREAGAQVEAVAAYRRAVPAASAGAWTRVRALLAGAPHAWLVTSSEGVCNLEELARTHLSEPEVAALKRAPLVAPHPRIAETARALGFDTITASGAGDERIAVALSAIMASSRASLDQPASAPSAQLRMTDSTQDSSTPPIPPAGAAPAVPFAFDEPRRRQRRGSALLWLLLIVVAAGAGAGGYVLNRKLDRVDARLVTRQQALDAQTAELRVKTDQALATARQVDGQFAMLQGKLADAQTAQQALQKQYDDLARNRDDWTFAEVEQMLSSASEQLQLTGNTRLALFALQSADSRLAALASAQAVVVRRAIAQDIDKLKSAPTVDLAGLAIKLDDAIAQVDALPLLGEAPVVHVAMGSGASAAAAATATKTAPLTEPRWKVWWREISAAAGVQLKELVQVRRIDNADAMLNTPEQGEFVRENVKLRLLTARLALFSRDAATLKSDLHAADAALARYFDGTAKSTRRVRTLVKDAEAGAASVQTPNINTSLQAVHNSKSRG